MIVCFSGGDAWRISGEDRAKHDAQFFTLKPVNGYISGTVHRFLNSFSGQGFCLMLLLTKYSEFFS